MREMKWDLFLLFIKTSSFILSKVILLISHFYHLFSTIDKKMIKNKKYHKIHHITINHLSHLIFFLFKLVRVGVCCFFKFHLIQFNQPFFLLKSTLSIINYKLFDMIFYYFIVYINLTSSLSFFEPIWWRNWFSFFQIFTNQTSLSQISPPTRFH